MLPTPPFTTPFAYSKTAPHANGPPFVWCIRIPGDDSPIERTMVEIVTDQHNPTNYVPFLKEWWSEKDPTAQPMVRI